MARQATRGKKAAGEKSGSLSNIEQYQQLLTSYQRSLAAANLSQRTIETYLHSARDFGTYLQKQGMPLEPESIQREHVESFINHILSSISPKTGRPYKAATAHNRYRGLQGFFGWLLEMDLIEQSPMAKMRPPRLPEAPPPILSDDQVKKLLRQCSGQSFTARRDLAIFRLLIDTGMRLSEVSNMRLDDIDWTTGIITVLGKGRKQRQCPVGSKTMRALDLYCNWARKQHPESTSARVWIGHEGPMTPSGIYQVVRDRAATAGIKCYPHMLRHLAAHRYLAAGGQETNLMRLMGWSSRSMLERYGASAAAERAREEHRRLGLGDKF